MTQQRKKKTRYRYVRAEATPEELQLIKDFQAEEKRKEATQRIVDFKQKQTTDAIDRIEAGEGTRADSVLAGFPKAMLSDPKPKKKDSANPLEETSTSALLHYYSTMPLETERDSLIHRAVGEMLARRMQLAATSDTADSADATDTTAVDNIVSPTEPKPKPKPKPDPKPEPAPEPARYTVINERKGIVSVMGRTLQLGGKKLKHLRGLGLALPSRRDYLYTQVADTLGVTPLQVQWIFNPDSLTASERLRLTTEETG